MKNRIFLIALILSLTALSCKSDTGTTSAKNQTARPDIGVLYTRIFRLIDIKECDLAFSELKFYLRFYSAGERKKFDIQNLFAKYILEGEDPLDNVVENYARLFEFFDSSDAEAVYQMLMYRSSGEKDIERAALIVASKADEGRSDAGLYYFLAYTFYNLRMREQANRYLDCLITIAPSHRAVSNLVFRIRGKKPDYRAEAVESLRNLYAREITPVVYANIAMNFHIPAMMNREWEEAGRGLLENENYMVKSVAYSEIPIFYARKGDGETLYRLLKSQILANDYRLFSFAARSLLYVYKEPHTVIDRLKKEFEGSPFVSVLSAKYLLSLGADYINEAKGLFLSALEKDNNIEIFYEAADVFSRTSEIFKLKSFAEELLFKYPYHFQLYNIYRRIAPDAASDRFFSRYFEHIPESPGKYLIFSSVVSEIEMKKKYLSEGLSAYRGDCSIIMEILRLYSDCKSENFNEFFNDRVKNYAAKEDFYRCIKLAGEDEKDRFYELVSKGVRRGCKE
ncbi:MAG: hypothetical protein N3B13_00345 [Deltaproteobacteria bacterium]|nr:hypothetical protein [Deltaproteobacteria bacterium]